MMETPRSTVRSTTFMDAEYLAALSMVMATTVTVEDQKNRRNDVTRSQNIKAKQRLALSASYGSMAKVAMLGQRHGGTSPGAGRGGVESDPAFKEGVKRAFTRHFCRRCGVFKTDSTVERSTGDARSFANARKIIFSDSSEGREGGETEEANATPPQRLGRKCRCCSSFEQLRQRKNAVTGPKRKRCVAEEEMVHLKPNNRRKRKRRQSGAGQSTMRPGGQHSTLGNKKPLETATTVATTPSPKLVKPPGMKNDQNISLGAAKVRQEKEASVKGTAAAKVNRPKSETEQVRPPVSTPAKSKGKAPPPKTAPKGKPSKPSSLQGLGIF